MSLDLSVTFRARAACRIVVRRGALESLGRLTRRATGATRVVLVTDSRVGALYGARAVASLRRAGIATEQVRVSRGERAKQPEHLVRLWRRLASLGVGRRDAIVALGGGVVGDLAGFAAASWLRGVPWVSVPSTVLAQADSGVGGKTGIDLPAGKNLVGAFHQPALVLVDPDLLATLSPRSIRAGLAEIAKIGMAVDARLFTWMERTSAALVAGDPKALEQAVARGLLAKLRVVRRDEREAEGGARTALNYGHTLGHAIEAARDYRGVLHGEAVALGMRAAGELSVRVAGLALEARARQERLLDALGLPRRMRKVKLAALFTAMRQDKKRRAGAVRWVLTPRMGHASVPRPIESRLVRAVLSKLGARF